MSWKCFWLENNNKMMNCGQCNASYQFDVGGNRSWGNQNYKHLYNSYMPTPTSVDVSLWLFKLEVRGSDSSGGVMNYLSKYFKIRINNNWIKIVYRTRFFYDISWYHKMFNQYNCVNIIKLKVTIAQKLWYYKNNFFSSLSVYILTINQ